jgi:hypothetical protein
MLSPQLTQIASRRDVMRGVAGIGLAAPLAVAHPATALVQDKPALDYSGHPAVGIWIGTISGYPYADHKFAYGVTHADGTFVSYDPWVAHYPGNDLGLDVGDPTRLTTIRGVWRPTGERTAESTGRFLWGDTTSTLLATVWGRSRLSEDGNTSYLDYRLNIVDAAGKYVMKDDRGSSTSHRMEWEPFEEPATPAATPGT